MGNSKTITVKTSNGEVEVRKLKLGEYSTLLKALNALPKEVGDLTEGKSKEELKAMSTGDMMALMIDFSDVALKEFCNALAIPTDKDGEFFLEGDLADAVDVFVAALELNDYSRIIESLKKLQTRRSAEKKALDQSRQVPAQAGDQDKTR